MSPRKDRYAESASLEGEKSGSGATRVVFEGNDAVEQVARLLGTRDKPASTGAMAGALGALARALEKSRSDLPARLERRLRSVRPDRDDLLSEVLRQEARDPDIFFAGALAGFALAGVEPTAGARTDDTASRRKDQSPQGGRIREGVGIARQPVRSALTGSGGLGSLESPAPAQEPNPVTRRRD